MTKTVCTVLFTALLSLSSIISVSSQESRSNKTQGRRFRIVEPNVYSPSLYADKFRAQFTLVDLPGGSETGNRWQVSYRLYFIPENEYWKVMRSGQTISEPTQFPVKILLTEGQFSRINLRTLRNRIYVRDGIPFKSKIPQQDQTKFGMLMTAYSARIYDAR